MNFTKINNFNNSIIEYYKNDALALSSIDKNKYWNPHVLTFIYKYNMIYGIYNIIDVGANNGFNTINYSNIIKNNGIVFAYEGQQQNYELLKKNMEKNRIRNILTYNIVCDSTKRTVKMPIINLEENINMGDVTPDYRHIYSSGYTDIETILLDSIYFPLITIIIIDVQGWEINVLQGSLNLIEKDKPVIIIEIEQYQLEKVGSSSMELINYIRNMKYYIYYLEYSYPSSHICIHNDKLEEFNNKFKEYIFENNTDNNVNNHLKFGVDKKIVLNF